MLYIRDDRYSTTTLEVVNAADDDAARALALAHLASSTHHLGAEVWEDNRPVARVERPYEPPPA